MKFLLLIAALLFIAYVLKAKKNSASQRALFSGTDALAAEEGAKDDKPFKAERKAPLTEREQDMYKVLKAAFEEPTFHVLSQVSMQALITTPKGDQSMRNRYDRKYVDFVICSPSFFVIAVIELDDRTHNWKKDKDAERDAMLESAGIKTTRFPRIPHDLSPAELREAILNPKMERVAESREKRRQYWARRNAWKKQKAE